MSQQSLDRRFRRRELHRSRSVAVSVLLGLVVVIAAWVGTEAVLAALGRPALLATPAAMLATVLHPLAAESPWVITGAVVGAVVGVIAIVLACAPGAKARKVIVDDRGSILIDDDLLASDLSRSAGSQPGAQGAQIRTVVGPRIAVVSIQPVSGLPVDGEQLRQRLDEHVAAIGLRRPPRVRARVNQRGRVER